MSSLISTIDRDLTLAVSWSDSGYITTEQRETFKKAHLALGDCTVSGYSPSSDSRFDRYKRFIQYATGKFSSIAGFVLPRKGGAGLELEVIKRCKKKIGI